MPLMSLQANLLHSWYDDPRAPAAPRTCALAFRPKARPCDRLASMLTSFARLRLRRPLPQHEPDQALLAELRRLPQVHHRQGRGLRSLPSGALPCDMPRGDTRANGLQFMLAYKSLCPSGWTNRWDDQREAGNFPVNLEQ